MTQRAGTISNIDGAKVLAVLGDMITTDHISPAGSFKDTPRGQYLIERQVPPREFNSYGSRRGNHEVMMRGTFANIRIKNEMLDGLKAATPKGRMARKTSIFDAPWPSGRRHAAGDLRGRAIRRGFFTRLGGQRHSAFGCQSRDRRKLRAYPPLQPCGHGRDPV